MASLQRFFRPARLHGRGLNFQRSVEDAFRFSVSAQGREQQIEHGLEGEVGHFDSLPRPEVCLLHQAEGIGGILLTFGM